ncbi:uncharacterized protein DNG_09483 [Cephalotrichum gorgonifer]|uniref:Uncharacterized protein n=1 Tax=Cephalotrichum gorgonifer TaxID=2041049 RepID=A0AAE8N6Z9_9PEZI|nr:uncharacterized protein DNG_09483 [Cephalotrichum gorgonifer]
MRFKGPVKPGGEFVELEGTAQEVQAKLLELNPSYAKENFTEFHKEREAVRVRKEESDRRAREKHGSLEKRDWMNCENAPGNEAWIWAYVGDGLTEGINYLNGLNGYCWAPRGWGGCSRVSCSWSLGITLCNDNDFEVWVWCGNLAGDAWDIWLDCGRISDDGWTSWLKGQLFRSYSFGWNTIVNQQNC